MRTESLAYLVPQPLAGDDGNLIAYPLVGLEVEGELGVVALNDDLGGLLDRLRANATHVGGGRGRLSRGWCSESSTEKVWCVAAQVSSGICACQVKTRPAPMKAETQSQTSSLPLVPRRLSCLHASPLSLHPRLLSRTTTKHPRGNLPGGAPHTIGAPREYQRTEGFEDFRSDGPGSRTAPSPCSLYEPRGAMESTMKARCSSSLSRKCELQAK